MSICVIEQVHKAMESTSKSFLQIDLNEAPPNVSSPREPPGSTTGPMLHGSVVCGSCGNREVEGEMLVCVRCGRGFHMKCMGTKRKTSDWKCFSCLFAGKGGELSSERFRNGGAGGGGEGLLDMNAPPPEEDEEVQFLRARRTGGGYVFFIVFGCYHCCDYFSYSYLNNA